MCASASANARRSPFVAHVDREIVAAENRLNAIYREIDRHRRASASRGVKNSKHPRGRIKKSNQKNIPAKKQKTESRPAPEKLGQTEPMRRQAPAPEVHAVKPRLLRTLAATAGACPSRPIGLPCRSQESCARNRRAGASSEMLELVNHFAGASLDLTRIHRVRHELFGILALNQLEILENDPSRDKEFATKSSELTKRLESIRPLRAPRSLAPQVCHSPIRRLASANSHGDVKASLKL